MNSRETPILSTLGDAAADEAYGTFLLELGEVVDWIQEAELRGDLDEIAKRCATLEHQGVRFGLTPLRDASAGARAACRLGDLEAVRDALVVLTDVARRVRLGSTVR